MKPAAVAVAILIAGALTGCGSLSRNISSDGTSAGQLIWPDPANAIAIHRGGTFPDPAAVQRVQAGMNKQQIMRLIGPPHFDEGFAGVRDWTYLFNFRNADGAPEQCEYKILFDTQRLARSFYWKPESCSAYSKPSVAESATKKSD
jgi:outer membrane protein assembly factor BamE (lipoprotein component of BamABCDE complex)